MCEVEFWEVFPRKVRGFLSGAYSPLVDCRIANLEVSLVAILSKLLKNRPTPICSAPP